MSKELPVLELLWHTCVS